MKPLSMEIVISGNSQDADEAMTPTTGGPARISSRQIPRGCQPERGVKGFSSTMTYGLRPGYRNDITLLSSCKLPRAFATPSFSNRPRVRSALPVVAPVDLGHNRANRGPCGAGSTTMKTLMRALLLTLVAFLLSDTAAWAQSGDGAEVIGRLRQGGYVIAMRHASSPRTPPDAANANPRNTNRERELDANGLATARAMGDAWRALEIPIGTVLTSPTFRAVQTVEALGLEPTREVDELGDGGAGMAPDTEGRRSEWLRNTAAQPPQAGTNTLLVTHLPNLTGAFGDAARGMTDGEALILMPQDGRATVVTRIKIDEWPSAAAAR